MPSEASRLLEEQLGALGVKLTPLFPGIEPTADEMVAQFSGSLPGEVVDERLVEVRALPGVDYAYKKATALPAPEGDTAD